jgi:hypothetical protein
MRLTNYKVTKIIPGIYYFALVIFFLIIFLNYQLNGTLFKTTQLYCISLIGIGLILIYIYTSWKYFEYDGGGEVIVFLNRGVLLSKFTNYRTKTVEVNRYKMESYQIHNFLIYKRLVVNFKNKNKFSSKHCNITILSPKKINYLRQSLDKIISKNKL